MKKITQTQTVISLILIHFREPITYLRTLLDDSISCEDKENDIEFTLGKEEAYKLRLFNFRDVC